VSPRLEIREVPGKGRGVFALEAIPEGTIIEECPVIVVPSDDLQALGSTVLSNYFFRWGPCEDDAAIALGFGSLYNHASEPNAVYVRKLQARTLAFVSLRDIATGEEITVNYHGGFGDRSPTWFEEA
jgi:SET domain-containing protein